ncbi:hypothetical protein [Clostridium baratii]|uniref:Uncharacterized protein n=1 Tax=Clostridium baratii TaxID=1561 RepID=A0A174RMP0_9CLOT|nr:hypothetical protein [Clostridium baratii]CUP85007.1 Uncharacterised protein [Clostridium baratii]
MGNKVTLIYENGEYSVSINDKLISVNKHMENAIERFTQVISDNEIIQGTSWETMMKELENIKDSRLVIDREYKTLTFENLKYFYSTGKVFNMESGKMQALIGGYHLFSFIVKMVEGGYINNYLDVLDFCKEILEQKVPYRTSETSLIVSDPGFNYGSAEYNFVSGKINKGATIEKASFDTFKEYVLNSIR